LTKLAAAFDPGVLALVLLDEESSQLLTQTYMELKQSQYVKFKTMLDL